MQDDRDMVASEGALLTEKTGRGLESWRVAASRSEERPLETNIALLIFQFYPSKTCVGLLTYRIVR